MTVHIKEEEQAETRREKDCRASFKSVDKPDYLTMSLSIFELVSYYWSEQKKKIEGSVWHFKRVPCQSVNIKIRTPSDCIH